MATASPLESEAKFWLQTVLKEEHLKDISVKIVGSTEKGDGFLGDIAFVHVLGTRPDDTVEEYHLVLKCSKRSEKLRIQSPVREIFLNEINAYERVLPAYRQFEAVRGVDEPFDNVSKYYGSFVADAMEVLGLENLKVKGYQLWDRMSPVPAWHIDAVVRAYGQLHAIGVAMKDQEPEKFKALVDPICERFKKMRKDPDEMHCILVTTVDEVYEMLKDELHESVLSRWQSVKDGLDTFLDTLHSEPRVKVIVHGDCWSNNFLYLYQDEEKTELKKVAILDWQMSRLSTPIFDLSYFLFACISEGYLEHLDVILENYYTGFVDHLEQLGSRASILYPYEEFLSDWRKYSKYGVTMSSLVLKMCSAEKDEVIDIAELAEQGKSVKTSFTYKIKDKTRFKQRMRPIVKYAVRNDLI